MRVIWSTLLVYGIAFAAVFGLQLLAVTALLTWRTGTLDLERDALTALLVGVPASSLTLIATPHAPAAAAARCGWNRVVIQRCPRRAGNPSRQSSTNG